MTFPAQQTLPLTLGALAVRHAFAVSQAEAARASIHELEREIGARRQTIEALLVRIKGSEERAKDYWDAMEAQLLKSRAAEAAAA